MRCPHSRPFTFVIGIVVFLFIGIPLQAQTYNMANGTINTCSGTFYDPGGAAGNYTNNFSSLKQFVRTRELSPCQFYCILWTQGGNDVLRFMTDRIQTSPLIGVFPEQLLQFCHVFIRLSHFTFVTNGSTVRSGWTASISCGGCGTTYLMNNNTAVNTCEDCFMTAVEAEELCKQSNFTKTFCSSTPGSCLQLQFTAVRVKANDILTVYNGNSVASPLIGAYTGTTLPPTMLSSSGCLTVNFTSNNASVDMGWAAIITCEICPSTPAGSATYTHPTAGLQNTYVGNNMVNTCSGTYTDNGGIAGNYSNNIGTSSIFGDQGYYRTFCPNQAGKCLRLPVLFFRNRIGNWLPCHSQWSYSGKYDSWRLVGRTTYDILGLRGAGIGPPLQLDQSGCLTFEFYQTRL